MTSPETQCLYFNLATNLQNFLNPKYVPNTLISPYKGLENIKHILSQNTLLTDLDFNKKL